MLDSKTVLSREEMYRVRKYYFLICVSGGRIDSLSSEEQYDLSQILEKTISAQGISTKSEIESL
jgi:hypothetical protein